MTADFLKLKLASIEKECWEKKKAVLIEYANDHNPYKIDDIIQDHNCIIQIKKIDVHISGNASECIYTGVQLNKDRRTPSKLQKQTTIYQRNIGK